MPKPEIALLLSTYQKPAYLRRVLASIAKQQGVAGQMELVVTDDGSTDSTPDIVAQFGREAPFPVHFTTHPHGSFHLTRCRNEGVAATTAPYLLFLDGDCILPPDHVATHLAHRKPGEAMVGDCLRLEQDVSERITVEAIERGDYAAPAPASEIARHRKKDRKARFYRFLGSKRKPKLVGNNFALWRDDYQRVNGLDENYVGWGCEDDDLGQRLRAAGVRLTSILRYTHSLHLWHPRDVTAPTAWRDGPNIPYFLRPGRLTRCRNGLQKRDLADLAVRLLPGSEAESLTDKLRSKLRGAATQSAKPEVELLVLPGPGKFSGQAECNLLVVSRDCAEARAQMRKAHVLVTPSAAPAPQGTRHFTLDQLDRALAAAG